MLYDYSNGIISVIFPQAGVFEPAKDRVRAKFAILDHGPRSEELGTAEDISDMMVMDVSLLT